MAATREWLKSNGNLMQKERQSLFWHIINDLKDITQHFVLSLDISNRCSTHHYASARLKLPLQSFKCSLISALPAGIVARQLLSTLTAESVTAEGVRASSHAGQKNKNYVKTQITRDKGGNKIWNRYWYRTFSAAGHGALEGARDGLPGFLLSRSLFQRRRVDQLAGRRGNLRSSKRQNI